LATKKTIKKLKLYVWEDVLVDYSSGVMFALASSAAEARELISPGYTAVKKLHSKNPLHYRSSMDVDLDKDPEVVSSPAGFSVHGGG
jgi:hypothetical protein